MEDDKRVTSFKGRYTKDRTIWSLFHSSIKWTRMDNKTFSVYTVKRNDNTSREKDTILQVIQYVQAGVGHRSRTTSKETQ